MAARVVEQKKQTPKGKQKVAVKTSVRNRRPSPARPVGRPLTLTPQVHKKIVSVLAKGNYRRVAALAAGIVPRTLDIWLYDGQVDHERGDNTVFSRLFLDIVRAEQKVTQEMVACLVREGGQDAKFSVEYLQRRHPDEWGTRSRVVHEGDPDKPLQGKVNVTVDVSERVERFRPLLEKLAGMATEIPALEGTPS